MGLFNTGGDISPLQHHPAYLATDIYVAAGTLETMGNPHAYINQDALDYLHMNEAHVAPWTFTGLPNARSPILMNNRNHVQMLLFAKPEALEQYREPPRTEQITFYLPLMIVRGAAPFLGDSKLQNFMDSWKGDFVPINNAAIHLLAEGSLRIPAQVPMLYINRNHIQGYQAS
ncbi:MAG TPA: hypothetical protein ENN14_00625 [Chloroflexi bacterium]|nr:hypothetical protein [Chloroflexota bacterium]